MHPCPQQDNQRPRRSEVVSNKDEVPGGPGADDPIELGNAMGAGASMGTRRQRLPRVRLKGSERPDLAASSVASCLCCITRAARPF
jgi:hypothetical protein